jgi:hypothetical protein
MPGRSPAIAVALAIALGLFSPSLAQDGPYPSRAVRLLAAKYLPVEQLAVSPQCGFSSSIGVPQLPEDVEWRKFETLIKTAEAIWGHV